MRPAPEGYAWFKSVNKAKEEILEAEYMYKASRAKEFWEIELIDIDHDAGDYAFDGGGLYLPFRLARRDGSQLSHSYSLYERRRHCQYAENYSA